MSDRKLYKLGLFSRKKRFPVFPEQADGKTYGMVWDLFGKDEHEACYVVEFAEKNAVALLAYVRTSGEVYEVVEPVAENAHPEQPAMQLVLDSSDPTMGEIVLIGPNGASSHCAYTAGSPEDMMHERTEAYTWNAIHKLPYAEFMATMYVRYALLGAQITTRGPKDDTEDIDELLKDPAVRNAAQKIELQKLDEPVQVLAGFDTSSLPDAIETLLYRVDHAQSPSGIERYAASLMGEIDLPRLRTIAAKTELSLARIDRSRMFYLNFDRSLLDQGEVWLLLAIEGRLNRISAILDRIGAGLGPASSSPSYEGCALIDEFGLRSITSEVPRLLKAADAENPWARPGTVACEPGGEWDVRTRFAHLAESLNVLTRLDYSFGACASKGFMVVDFDACQDDAMPMRLYHADDDSWEELGDGVRAICAVEHDSRVALTLAAACFGAGLTVSRCFVRLNTVCEDGARETTMVYAFDRVQYLSELVEAAERFETEPTDSLACNKLLSTFVERDPGDIEPSCAHARPREDPRPLPVALRDLLLADTAAELEVMEEDDDPYTARIVELREQLLNDKQGAYEGFTKLVEELEARGAVAELLADGPVQSQFCENQLVRLVLPVMEENRATRILRAPDALYFAQYEICNLVAEAQGYEAALPEARHLYDLARSSMQSHYVLINVLAHLERYDEVIEVARHGLRVAFDREAIGYLFYRLAFAYWNCDQRELALACYRLVPRGDDSGQNAQEEMEGLMNEMGVSRAPSFEDAVKTVQRAGLDLPPTPIVNAQIADAAVQLVDNGFFFLAARCVYQMWRTMGNDDLGALNRSLN